MFLRKKDIDLKTIKLSVRFCISKALSS